MPLPTYAAALPQELASAILSGFLPDGTAFSVPVTGATAETPASSGKNTAVTVPTTANGIQLDAAGALTNRKQVIIANEDATNRIFIGFANTVTTANGLPIQPKEKVALPYGPTLQIWAIAETGSVAAILQELA